jgi:hypothetical protein
MLEKIRRMPDLMALPLTIAAGLIFFAASNPKNLPPAALIIGFLIVAAIIYSFIRLVARLFGWREKWSKTHYAGLLVVGTSLPVLLLALQSIGQLTPRDVITLVVLFVAGYIYASRIKG